MSLKSYSVNANEALRMISCNHQKQIHLDSLHSADLRAHRVSAPMVHSFLAKQALVSGALEQGRYDTMITLMRKMTQMTSQTFFSVALNDKFDGSRA